MTFSIITVLALLQHFVSSKVTVTVYRKRAIAELPDLNTTPSPEEDNDIGDIERFAQRTVPDRSHKAFIDDSIPTNKVNSLSYLVY